MVYLYTISILKIISSEVNKYIHFTAIEDYYFRYKEVNARSAQKQKIKLIVIAREKSGMLMVLKLLNSIL